MEEEMVRWSRLKVFAHLGEQVYQPYPECGTLNEEISYLLDQDPEAYD